MNATDYQSRTPRHRAPCTHPRTGVVKIGDALWKCSACGEWRGTMPLAEFHALQAQCAQVDEYNRKMARLDTAAKRLRFAKTGRV